jgi:hypothetical protein
MIAGIKKNGVGGLWPNSIQRKQFFAQFRRGPREHSLQRTAITRIEKSNESFQPLRFLPEVSRRANQLFKLMQRRSANSSDRQKPCSSQVAKRLFDVGPRMMTSKQDCAGHQCWRPHARNSAW